MTWTRIVTAGIALLIILPVLRVFLMLVVFVRERDFLFSAIATLVLAIIVLGSVLGVVNSPAGMPSRLRDGVLAASSNALTVATFVPAQADICR